HSTKASSLMYQFINGISKIRIAGVEDQALYEYLHPYVKSIEEEDRSSKIISFGSALSMIMNTAYTIVFYIIVIKNKQYISIGSFIAFTSMFASFSANIVNLSGNFVTLSTVRQKYRQQKQIFATEPEHTNAGELPGDISGNIEVNNVTFSYSKDEPPVLRNFSLNIRQGEYVGIVGPSGCGKSTLMKLLLGFEEPDSGKIYYDNKDIESIDKRELRKKMGVVLQNGKLISGSIYDNITITAPDAKREDVVNIIKAVGLESDIEDMPMGLYTMLSEDCNTISGGQQQRILIARALVSNPKILLFDEATSALDNITQSLISDTLDKTYATRVVIAHRLSTIIKCDRIIVMDKGRIVEQGTYDELMEMKGSFYQLASRQIS
ncbi:MAG: ATP-binding cassette domain-containing protein, partial [Clostridia bacterium]|nr:ATP-binding cassette domain-containing protein [Clostridia bacterium]